MKIFYKNYIFFLLLFVFININNIYASSIIYSEPRFNPDVTKPSPKIIDGENDIYYSDQDKTRSELEKHIIIQNNNLLDGYIEDNNKNQEYTFIRHTYSITTVGDQYEWRQDLDDPTKWRLFIPHSDTYDLPHFARSGFYKIGDITYGFDKNGLMITGLAKDEYDIIYEFDDSGRLINKYQSKK